MHEDGLSPEAPPAIHRRPGALGADVRVGDFQIERRLGSGGMGVVYQARQISLDRKVALKVLGDALNRPEDIARFRREAQAVARLDHPNIAGVYFVGQDQQLCYMAMELIDGASLRRVIDAMERDPKLTIGTALDSLASSESEPPVVRFDASTADLAQREREREAEESRPAFVGPTPRTTPAEHVRRAVEIVRDAALALAHAHERGVIHRDVKPENFLLDRSGQIRLIDFGVARFFEDGTITMAGQIVGTPTYMSPEQVTGRLEVDHRTDIYSLGLVLFELLTLGRAVDAPTREGVLRHVVTKALPPVSGLNRSVPPALMAVVHKAAAKDPDERYQTAEAFAADLKKVLDGKPVSAPPYRFKLDEREIDAERPKAIIGVSFEFAMIAVFGLFWTAQLCSLPAGARSFLGYSEDLAPILISGISAALVILPVAWAILTGRQWGRWAGMIGCLIWLVICARFLYGFVDSRSRIESTTFFASPIPPAIMALTSMASLACLASSSATHWFHLAQRIRSEQKLSRGRSA
ncbi:protein kinase domain-containing protein [Tundrisphaera lichenicola]|uniref:protein kinase domain-containing protein n=1 Tax=Tundrisphaera lichenicola TaxID=2029860 RepID=UPI003EBF76F1